MEKIKIIDLLNKVANGEEVPKKVKFDDKIFEHDNDDYVIKSEYPDVSDDYLFDNICANKEELNFEVEIIEEKVETSIEERLSKVERDIKLIKSFIK